MSSPLPILSSDFVLSCSTNHTQAHQVPVIALQAAFLMLPRSLLGSYGKPQDPVQEELLSEVWYQPFQAKLWPRDWRCTKQSTFLFVECKFKAMAVTRFCHLYILSYSKQELYKACTYVIKRSACCSLCTVHFQLTRKHVNSALKKAGLDVSSSSNLVPTFHVIMANPSQKKSCP
ncbi:INO80 complex subunit D-like [Gossypium australe]|uniref:KAT8 regulatory NSL complex subunit 2 n=1 Tax=Gossypium australe TaxID=47621 RepID=A0A5B6VPR1_9ROSI|nr:INO80 complex subunit D-like [Gossypium australe]